MGILADLPELVRYLRSMFSPDRWVNRHSRLHAAREWKARERKARAQTRLRHIKAIRAARQQAEKRQERRMGYGTQWA